MLAKNWVAWNISGSHSYFYDEFVVRDMKHALKKGCVILDVGCGKGVYGYFIRCQELDNEAYVIGLDIHEPYIKFAKTHRVYDEQIKSTTTNCSIIYSSTTMS